MSHLDTQKGEMIPQTVESLQLIMERDAVAMEAMGNEIAELKREHKNMCRKLEAIRKV